MPAPFFPEPPSLPIDRSATASMHLRYEDVAQDGRLVLPAAPQAIGEVVWRSKLASHELHRKLLREGILPILTRLVIEAGEDPVPVTRPLEASGGYELAHDVDARGEVDRIFLDIWCNLRGRRGRTHLPPSDGDGAPVDVARVYAEHVFTRPFASKEARKVRRFDVDGVEPVPPKRRSFRPLAAAAELPRDATPLDAREVLDEVPIVFGLAHTDSNQHVNSLVYLRLFEEALLRGARRHGLSTLKLGRWLEIGYRKPCFAGDRVRVRLRLFVRGDEIGAVGAFVPEDDPSTDQPHAWVSIGAR